jgi:DNA-binding MarR family transcriptional regulator
VLLVHHSGKTPNGPRVWWALFAGCDTVLELDSNDGVITLEIEKQKDAPAGDPWRFVLEPTGDSATLIPASSQARRGELRLSKNHRLVLEVLAGHMAPASFSELVRATNVAAMTITRALDVLIDRGLADADGERGSRHRTYSITPAGRAAWDALQEASGTVTVTSDSHVTNSELDNTNTQSLTHSNTPLRGVTDVSDVSESAGENESEPQPCPACGELTDVRPGARHAACGAFIDPAEELPLDGLRHCGPCGRLHRDWARGPGFIYCPEARAGAVHLPGATNQYAQTRKDAVE